MLLLLLRQRAQCLIEQSLERIPEVLGDGEAMFVVMMESSPGIPSDAVQFQLRHFPLDGRTSLLQLVL